MHYALDKLERRQGKYTSSAQFLLYEEKVYFERKEVFFYYIYIACLLKHWIYGYRYTFILRLGTNKRLIYYPKVKKRGNQIPFYKMMERKCVMIPTSAHDSINKIDFFFVYKPRFGSFF